MMDNENIYSVMYGLQQKVKHRIEKTTNVSFGGTNYDYIKLEEVLDIVKPLANENDILIIQRPVTTSNYLSISVETTLYHTKTGTSITGTVCIQPAKGGGQEAGSAITYARRYGLCTLFGVTPVNDDDDCAPKNANFFHKGKKDKPKVEYDGPTTTETVKKEPKKGIKKSRGLKKTDESVEKAAKSNFADE